MHPSRDRPAAEERIHTLLTELTDLIGPHAFRDHLDADHQADGHVFLSEWVLVASWVDETGSPYLSQISSTGLPGHTRKRDPPHGALRLHHLADSHALSTVESAYTV